MGFKIAGRTMKENNYQCVTFDIRMRLCAKWFAFCHTISRPSTKLNSLAKTRIAPRLPLWSRNGFRMPASLRSCNNLRAVRFDIPVYWMKRSLLKTTKSKRLSSRGRENLVLAILYSSRFMLSYRLTISRAF